MELHEARKKRCSSLSLLRHPDPGPSAYQIEAGDDQIIAEMSLAQLKELLWSFNELSRSVYHLQQEASQQIPIIEDIGCRLSSLEDRVSAFDGYIEEQETQGPETTMVLLKGTIFFVIGMFGCVLGALLPSPWCWLALAGTGLWYLGAILWWKHLRAVARWAAVIKEQSGEHEH
jgi:hypothetical protein